MKITGTEKREVQIELSQSDFDKLMIKRLYELYEWNPEFFIKDENIQSSFITHNAALMDAWDKSPEQFTKTESVPSVSTFDLGSEDIKNINAAMGVFKDLTEVIFTSQDGDMTISLGATNKFNAKSNTYSIRKPSNANKEFEIKIPVINFKSLPQTDYTVDVKYNSARDSYRILLTSKTLENFKVLMTVKI